MKKFFLLGLSILYLLQTHAQFQKFDIKNAFSNGDSNYIIYLTAVWCKPCMDELPDIIDSFKSISNYKLIVWFERSYLDTSVIFQKKLQQKFGDSLFYFFPLRYYANNKYKNALINPQNKILRQIMIELNSLNVSLNESKIKWKNWTWGKLILINDKEIFISKSIKKSEQIKEIKLKLPKYY